MGQGIELKNISRVYRQGDIAVHALSQVNLKIESGAFLSLFGPSGSGKSTLLNLIGGLDSPTSGEIFIAGKRIDQLSKNERAEFRLRHIGFVFQAYNLVPVLSAAENVSFVMELQGVSPKERKEKTESLLAEVGLQGLEDRRPGELSGGQQQRVAVARAMVSNPDIVLADEPTANLDSKTSTSLIELMKEMNERHKTTFVFSTHDPLVMENARRLVELKDGKIVSDKEQR